MLVHMYMSTKKAGKREGVRIEKIGGGGRKKTGREDRKK